MAAAVTEKGKKRLRAVIILLAVLTALSTLLLIGRVIYINFFKDTATTVVPHNLIGSEPSSTSDNESDDEGTTDTAEASAILELYKGKKTDNEPFNAVNMLPGDSEVKYFALRISHNEPVTLLFSSEINEQTRSLGNELNIKVKNLTSKRTVYNGSFSELSAANDAVHGERIDISESKETVVFYEITVSLSTDTGNEYQAASLSADFIWSVKEASALTPPATGDNGSEYLLVAVMLCSLGAMLVLLLLGKKRKGEEQNEE